LLTLLIWVILYSELKVIQKKNVGMHVLKKAVKRAALVGGAEAKASAVLIF